MSFLIEEIRSAVPSTPAMRVLLIEDSPTICPKPASIAQLSSTLLALAGRPPASARS
jgi:hypothetical protein